MFLQTGHDAADHSEIEERNPMIRRDEDIAGMGIGVEKAVHENLLEIGPKHFLGQGRAIELHPGKWTQFRNFFPGNEVHCEHPRGAIVGDRRRHDQPWKIAQLLAKRAEIARFLTVIEFLQESAPKLVEELAKFVALSQLGVLIEELVDIFERFKIFGHLLADAGPLHLHRHRPAIAKGGEVDLT